MFFVLSVRSFIRAVLLHTRHYFTRNLCKNEPERIGTVPTPLVGFRKSFEAEKRRAISEIQKLRKEVAAINSQMTKVRYIYQWKGDIFGAVRSL